MAYADRDRRDPLKAKEAILSAASQLAAAATHGKVPPHDMEAERAVLGSILLDNVALSNIEGVLAAGDFYHPAHGVIYEAALAIAGRSQPVDVVTLVAELRSRERLNTVGGAQYLGELTDAIPTVAHAESHARIVADLAGVRRMIEVAHEIIGRGYGERGNAEAFLDYAASKVFEVAQKRSKSTLIPLDQVILEAFERLEHTLNHGSRTSGTETGFRDLDNLTAGLHGGQLIIIAARPAMGKCLAADSEIVLEDGSVATIEEVYRRGAARLLTLGEDLRLRVAAPSHYVDDGVKPVFRVTTRSGRRVESTLTHPFLTVDGWRPLSEIAVGARVAAPRQIPIFGDRALRDCEVALLGYLLGDGSIRGSSPTFTNSDPRVLEDFTDRVRDFGGVQAREVAPGGPRAPQLRVLRDREDLAKAKRGFANRLHARLEGHRAPAYAGAGELGVTPSLVSQRASGACAPRETLADRLCEILVPRHSDCEGLIVRCASPRGVRAPRRAYSPSSAPLLAELAPPTPTLQILCGEVLGDEPPRELAADARGREDRSPLTRWLRDLGLSGRGAHTKRVPACVFTLPRAQVALFLNRLFATDGWATVLTSGQPQLGYASVSERLARQVQHLLLRFGVLSSLRERRVKYQGGERDAWQLDITAADSIRTFCAEIGIFGKEAAVAQVVAALQDRGRHSNRDAIPAEVWGQIDRARAGRSWGSLGRAMGLSAGINLHVGARGLSRERLGAMAELLEDDRLRALSASDVYWDEVVSIEYVGEKQVYDLTIPETHNFVANDVCVHNTSLVLNVATNAAVSSMKPVLVFSLEMPRVELANRLMCAEARVDQSRLRTNLLTQDEVTALTSAANKLHALPMYIDDSGDLTLLELRSKARRIKSERDMSLIIIDYLQLMKASRDKMESREREISEISRGLKALAKELDVPIIALSQLNRACETRPGKDKRPMLADLRESGAIEQDADVVMFIYRDEVYNRDTEDRGIAELIIAKQRNGPTDTVRLRFIRELTKFENLALDEGGPFHETAIGGIDEGYNGGGEEGVF